MGRFDRGAAWQAILDYGALFAPWIEGRAEPSAPLAGEDVARLRAVTERYGTGTALAWALTRRTVADADRAYASLGLAYGRAKVDRQLAALEDLVRALNAAGVTPLLLKGSAAQVAGVLPDRGFRLMADIDLLVPPDRLADAVAAAEGLGFTLIPSPEGASSHARSLHHADAGILLELHWRLARVHERDTLPAAAEFASATPASFRGTAVLLPDWTRHAALTILHAVAWHRSRHMALVPIKALLDIAALDVSGRAVDWVRVAALLEAAGERASLIHFELLYRTLFGRGLTGVAIPPRRAARILRYYALGAAYPELQHAGLAVSELHDRLMRVRAEPVRLLQLFRPRFYRNLAGAVRRALDPGAALQ